MIDIQLTVGYNVANSERTEEVNNMNQLKIKAGEKFRGNVSGNVFQIVEVKDGYAIIKDLAADKEIAYGIQALKRLAVTPIR